MCSVMEQEQLCNRLYVYNIITCLSQEQGPSFSHEWRDEVRMQSTAADKAAWKTELQQYLFCFSAHEISCFLEML